jgi:hypothetical protein
MRHFTNILLLLSTIISICSCARHKNLIGRSHTEYGRIKFYAIMASGDNFSVSKVYADVDSNGIKRYYSFYPDKIMMTDERAKGLSYAVLFRNLPDNYDSNNYRLLSPFDTSVLKKAKRFLNTSKYSFLKSPEGATGYEIEVNYLHGFPKNRKFQPL